MPKQILSYDELLKIAIDYYRKVFVCEPECGGCAPGRVNLIGDHVDYNDGYVLPMGLPLQTIVVGGLNSTNTCCVHTTSPCVGDKRDAEFTIPSVETLTPDEEKVTWVSYVKGVVATFPGDVEGFNSVIVSTVPVGAGLSSSAALEVAFYSFLESLTSYSPPNLIDKILACQKAEHEFAKMPCGIMDQYIAVYAKTDEVCLLDCRDLESSSVKWNEKEAVVLITNSHVKHNLSESEYPARKAACEEACEMLKVDSLRNASETMLNKADYKSKLPDVIFRRARHVITEIRRTYDAAKALEINDYSTFGLLMCQSHNSLRDDFEVSCPELDQLVDIAVNCEGVYGSRMTGGGFGGCTVTLLKKEAVKRTIEKIRAKYKGEVSFYIVSPANGARSFTLPCTNH